MFSIEMLPAQDGDCLWLEYGNPKQPRRLLLDGGRGRSDRHILARIARAGGPVHFEIVVITHVDQDHIEGVLNLLRTAHPPCTIGEVWFNGYRHLEETNLEEFGPVQGERLTLLLLEVLGKEKWNQRFYGRAVVVQEQSPLVPITLVDGLQLTVLSPSREKLLKLKPQWQRVCQEADIDPYNSPPEVPPGFERFGPIDIEALAYSPFEPDRTEANGSSIALLAEFEGKRIILAGDAHTDLLIASLQRLQDHASPFTVDAIKLPHHGSKANVSRQLIELLDCPRYLISTNGARFKHPDHEAVARVIKFGGPNPNLIFNYRSEYTKIWDNLAWMQSYGYRVQYPEQNNSPVRIDL